MSAPKPSTQVNAAASKGIMRPVNRFLEQWIPSALTFAIVLTLIVAVLAFIFTDAGPTDVVTGWGEGLAGLLEFMTQMCLILLLGHILANTGPVRKLLAWLARVPGNATFAYVFVFLVADDGDGDGEGLTNDEKAVRRWLAGDPSDSDQYKLWGNGLALPCAYFVFQGIKEVLDGSAV